MERRTRGWKNQDSPEEIRRKADQAEDRLVAHKQRTGQPLSPQDIAFLQKDPQKEDAETIQEYMKKFPTSDAFRAAIRRAAKSLAGAKKIEMEERACEEARKAGLLPESLPADLKKQIIDAVVETYSSWTWAPIRKAAKIYITLLNLQNESR